MQQLAHLQHTEITPTQSWMDRRVWDFRQRHPGPSETSLGAPLIALKFQLIPWIQWISYQFYSHFPGFSKVKETCSSSLKKFTKLVKLSVASLPHKTNSRSSTALTSLWSASLTWGKTVGGYKEEKYEPFFHLRGFLFSLPQKEHDSWGKNEGDLIIKSLRRDTCCSAAFRCIYLKIFKLLWGRKTSDS